MEVLGVSVYLVSAGAAWSAAQLIKLALAAQRSKSVRNLSFLYESGKMPSAHTATVVALAVSVGISEGMGSGVFATATVLSLVVMYDALMVRRSSGEQGVIVEKLRKDHLSDHPSAHVAIGHKPLEVAAGAALGVVVALVVELFITK